MLDLVAEHVVYAEDLVQAVSAVLAHGQFIMGPEVEEFEKAAEAYLGAGFAVSCNSGTDALVLALRALGIGPGDEVITTPFTFFATAEAVTVVGAAPVFADIDPETFNLDLAAVEAAISDRTRAIMPVHLFGQPADLDELDRLAKDRGLLMVEDAAQAFGAISGTRQVGTVGDCGAFSFFPSKPLGGLGDGGLVVTGDGEIADRLRMLRQHGSRRKYENEVAGYNSRLDTVQAAALLVKLRHLDAATKARRRVAERYDGHFRDMPGVTRPVLAPGRTHVYHQYTVRIRDGRRDTVKEALTRRGIASMVYYPVPLHRLPVYRSSQRFEHSERAASEVLSLPISPALTDEAVDEVADAVREALAG
jgi:dTDP-4-amino-4,6-dideoxygalactose transaminase